MSPQKSNKPDHESVIGVWFAVIIVSVVMGCLTMFLFGRFQWWMALPITFVALAAVITTIQYVLRELIRTCPNCNKALSPNATYCRGCGTSVALNCPNCQAKINGKAQFCSKCGVSLIKVSSYNTSQTVQTQIRPQVVVQEKHCRQCGVNAGVKAQFSHACGNPL
jgi:ribosomal protein L40E